MADGRWAMADGRWPMADGIYVDDVSFFRPPCFHSILQYWYR
jgi:hypothetical protein